MKCANMSMPQQIQTEMMKKMKNIETVRWKIPVSLKLNNSKRWVCSHFIVDPLRCSNKIYLQQSANGSTEYLSPPSSARRRSSVMFNEYVILHTPPNLSEGQSNKNISQVEKTTQTGDGNIWKVEILNIYFLSHPFDKIVIIIYSLFFRRLFCYSERKNMHRTVYYRFWGRFFSSNISIIPIRKRCINRIISESFQKIYWIFMNIISLFFKFLFVFFLCLFSIWIYIFLLQAHTHSATMHYRTHPNVSHSYTIFEI